MKSRFYRLRRGQWFCGVLNGIADSFHFDLKLLRLLFLFALIFSHGTMFFTYLILAVILPYKKEEERENSSIFYGQSNRRRKDVTSSIID